MIQSMNDITKRQMSTIGKKRHINNNGQQKYNQSLNLGSERKIKDCDLTPAVEDEEDNSQYLEYFERLGKEDQSHPDATIKGDLELSGAAPILKSKTSNMKDHLNEPKVKRHITFKISESKHQEMSKDAMDSASSFSGDRDDEEQQQQQQVHKFKQSSTGGASIVSNATEAYQKLKQKKDTEKIIDKVLQTVKAQKVMGKKGKAKQDQTISLEGSPSHSDKPNNIQEDTIPDVGGKDRRAGVSQER